jgi:hypothetical protein
MPGYSNKYQDKVIGTWDTDLPNSPRFTFNKDGTGELSVPALGAASPKKTFTWRLRSNNLIVKLDGKESGFLIKSIEGDKMDINDPDEKGKQDFVFTRVKK